MTLPLCPKCGLPMSETGNVHTSMPEKYGYRCEACGAYEMFTRAQLNALPPGPEPYIPIPHAEYQALIVSERRMKLVADALLKVLIHDGMIRADVDGLTGPELLTAADTYVRTPPMSPEGLLEAGEVVPREDGRFYVPVSRVDAQEGVANIVLRVASDAFGGDVLAAALFADEVVHRWNGKA